MRAPALFVALIRGAKLLSALRESVGFGSAGVLHRWKRRPAVVSDWSARWTTHP